MTSILLVEDHSIMAGAITRLLEEQGRMNVVSVVDSAEAAEQTLADLDVDLVLVDVSLPKSNGITLVEKIHKDHPQIPCVMLSGHRTTQYVNRSLAAGARGYLLKDDVEGILQGIKHVLAGNTYVSKELRKA